MAAATTTTTPMTSPPPPPPLPDSSTSSASFFTVPKCKKKNYTLKLSALGGLIKIEAFLPKSNSDHQTGRRQGLKPLRFVRCYPHLPPASTNEPAGPLIYISSFPQKNLRIFFLDVIYCTIMSFCAPCGDLLFFFKKREGDKNSIEFMI